MRQETVAAAAHGCASLLAGPHAHQTCCMQAELSTLTGDLNRTLERAAAHTERVAELERSIEIVAAARRQARLLAVRAATKKPGCDK